MSEITPEVVEQHGLSTKEYERVLHALGREPNLVELGIFSVMWSEHCSYKSSRLHLKKLPTEAPWVICGPGENAGVIDIGDGQAAIFKMESHNHPSYIEPYQGAATGVGGILRDVFTMGARPVANANALRFGRPEHPKMKHLVQGVVAGIGGYGNCVGVPTVCGETNFHPAYDGNILVNAMTVGVADADKIFYSAATGVGNPIVYVGSKTGRDGIHGATMASADFEEDADAKRPTVQVGDPFTEKLLIEACLERKFIPIGLALVALYGATSLVPAIGSQFFPAGVRDQIFVHVDLPEGVSFDATRQIVEQVEEVVVETSADADGRERLKNYVSFVGTGGPRLMLTMSPEDGRLGYAFVLINTDQATDSQEWIPQLRGALASIPGARIDVRRFSLGPPLAQPVEYRLSGTDPQVLRDAAEEMIAQMRAVPGMRDPQQNWMNSAYELRLDVDQEAASLAGLSNAQIASSLDVLLGGSTLTTVRDGEDRIPLVLRLRPEQRASAFDLDAVFVEGASGKIPLSAVAATTAQWSPAIIKRINQQRTITVGARVEDGYLATQLSAEIQPQLQEIVDALPPGYQLEERGEVYETTKSQGEFGGALGLSLLLILAVLTWQYNSLAKALIVLMAVPLALIGIIVLPVCLILLIPSVLLLLFGAD